MQSFRELIDGWGYGLSEMLKGQLEAGSMAALLVVFAAGVLTSLTPCVYPMIPVTVTYMGAAASGSRRRAVGLSLIYVLGMALIYSGLGVVTALLGRTFGQFTYSPWVYGGVGLLILLFGVAMLDLVVIPVPARLGAAQSQVARRGGYVGALAMGLAAGFVAAPCTAPVMGLLLVYVARTRDVLWGGTLLLSFALGLGLLLMLLGIFSGMLSSLPRAGVWMSWIKKAFGYGMLLVAAWFLYKAASMLLGSAS